LELYRRPDNKVGVADTPTQLANLHIAMGNFEEAKSELQEAPSQTRKLHCERPMLSMRSKERDRE